MPARSPTNPHLEHVALWAESVDATAAFPADALDRRTSVDPLMLNTQSIQNVIRLRFFRQSHLVLLLEIAHGSATPDALLAAYIRPA
jgi:hypothetical protein